MSYMVAKDFKKPGSVALKHLPENIDSDVDYLEDLTTQWIEKDIQILTVGNFEVYAEYEPVTYVDSREDFEDKITEMVNEKVNN